MRDDHDRHTLLPAGVLQELEDLLAGHIVERAGRLVAEQELRIFRQRAGDGDALLLAAGELTGEVVRARGQADFVQDRRCVERVFTDLRRELDVFKRRQVADEVIELEDKADVVAAIGRELAGVEAAHARPVDRDGAARAGVHAAEHVEDRRLARARGADDDAEFTLFDRKADVVHRANFDLSAVVDLGNILKCDESRHSPTPPLQISFLFYYKWKITEMQV